MGMGENHKGRGSEALKDMSGVYLVIISLSLM